MYTQVSLLKVAAMVLCIPSVFRDRKKSMAGGTIIAEYFHFFGLLASYMLVTFQEKIKRLPDDFRVIFPHSLKAD